MKTNKDKYPIRNYKENEFDFLKGFQKSEKLEKLLKKKGFERTFTQSEIFKFFGWLEKNHYLTISLTNGKFYYFYEGKKSTKEELINIWLKNGK